MTAFSASLPSVRRLGLLATLLSATARSLGAQSGVGRIEGTITDSIHARPLASASVLAIRLDPPERSGGATSDARGHYRVDSLPAGRYMVEFESPLLDSLEITLPPRDVLVEAGRVARLDFALPSGRTLRAAACPGVSLTAGTGAVVGQIVNADDESPLSGARVLVSWSDITVDRATLAVTTALRGGDVTADSLGRYRLCGVPTDEWLQLRVEYAGRAGRDIRLQVPDSAGLLVRHLSLSASAARVVSDTAPTRGDSASTPLLAGTASVSGVVRGVGGLPLGGAQVRVLGAAPVILTDDRGRFTLGDLPAGTQVLEVRRIGYLLGQQPVELRSARTVVQDVRLRRIVTLDSVRVLARATRYREFAEHRRRSGFGTFLTEDDIERKHAFQTSDLFHMMLGFRVSGFGIDAKVVSTRGAVFGPCEPNVVIDGMPNQEINLIDPSNIGAMEVYRAGAPGPIQYEKGCGVIMIWTKR